MRTVIKLPFAEYQSIQKEKPAYPTLQGLLIHPFADKSVMAGNGTIGLEILEDLPDVDTILVPFGGGGLSCGIAASIKAGGAGAHVVAVEVATATPITASLSAGKSVEVPYHSSFVSGMGAPFVFPQMWPLASRLLDGAQVVELKRVGSSIRMMAERHHILAEGAGRGCIGSAPGRGQG